MDTFMALKGIPGESTDARHEGEIEVIAWSWEASAAASRSGTSAARTGRAQIQDFHFVHRYDAASPVLFRSLVENRRIEEARLTARKSGRDQHEFLVITLREVTVGSVSEVADENEVSESVSLRFESVNIEYRSQDDRGGAGTTVTAEWSARVR